jgi:hypothetical protein
VCVAGLCKRFSVAAVTRRVSVPCITAGLESNFKEVSVEVTECPDLRQEPFRLAAEGLSGNARIAGQRNFVPTLKLDRKYSLLEISTEGLPARGKCRSFSCAWDER